jgi:exodeoxyribonuclease V alpha subunit
LLNGWTEPGKPEPKVIPKGNRLTGILDTIKFYQNNYLIGVLDNGASIKGHMPAPQGHGPQVGLEYEFTGRWDSHPRWGHTFVFSDYKTAYPKDLDAIRRYLMENAKWIGPEISKKLVKAYGEDTLQVCKAEPERVAREIPGITLKRAKEISAMLRQNEAQEELQLKLKNLLAGSRIGKRAVNQLIERYGEHAPEVLRENPYRLIDEIDGIGFVTADEIAKRAGFAPEGKPRLLAGLLHILKESAFGQGHTCLPKEYLLAEAGKLLGIQKPLLAKVLNESIKNELLIEYKDYIYLPRFFEDEKTIATKLKILAGNGIESGTPCYEGLQPDQVEALSKAVKSRVFILTGGPGTGKTFTIKRIIDSFPDARIVLAAPTGKASKRMTEQTGQMAFTIHKLLEPTKMGNHFIFSRDEDNPIEADIIVVDELSMTDTPLMASLMKAVSPHSRLILVGDTYQLPSVGPGNILKDMIESGLIPCTELTIIKRQDEGLIIRNSHRIKNGQDIELGNSTARDFFFLQREDEQSIQETILNLIAKRLPESYKADPLRDIQIISPLREKTRLSCKALNELCQARLNPNPKLTSGNGSQYYLKVGDKVIQCRNDYEHEIVNGDIGYVRGIDKDDRLITVEFENPSRLVPLPLYGNDLELAYTVTTHRFQGSEAPIVVIPIHRCFGTLIMQRNWIYTSISRAKQVCILVGQREEVPKIIRRNQQQRRFTNLAELLSEG